MQLQAVLKNQTESNIFVASTAVRSKQKESVRPATGAPSFHRLLSDDADQKECEISGLEEGPPTQNRCQFPSSYFVAGLRLNNRDETAAGSSEGPTA